jgi:thymidylate synthase (FAD)
MMNTAEQIPHGALPILDHGYLKFVEAWGHGDAGEGAYGQRGEDDTEVGIIEAARQSTQGGFKGWGPLSCPRCIGSPMRGHLHEGSEWRQCSTCKGAGTVPGDDKLLSFLWNHKHTTPFEFAGMTLEVRAPIMVYREWHRHRTQSYSEASARYGPLPNLHYMPSRDRIILGAQPTDNRQAQGMTELNTFAIDPWLANVADYFERGEQLYQEGLQNGFPKEIARIVHTVARYSTMRVSTDLWNWLHFTTLRSAPNAQEEIRHYANGVLGLLAAHFPLTMSLVRANG